MDFETLMRAKNELEPRVRQLCAHLDPERKALELEQIEEKAAAPGFWDDPEAAKPLLKKRGACSPTTSPWPRSLTGGLEDLETGPGAGPGRRRTCWPRPRPWKALCARPWRTPSCA